MKMTSLKCKFITCIIGCREKLEKQSPSNTKYTDYTVEVIKLVFKVQNQSFADVTFSRTPLMAASENLRNVFAQKKFFLQLKLCLYPWILYHTYFHSYSFATGMTKMSSNIFFNNVLF